MARLQQDPDAADGLERRTVEAFPVPRLALGGAVIVVAALVLVVLAVKLMSGFESTGPAQVAVIYNDGPFDKRDQRATIPESSGRTYTGWLSQDPRYYPSTSSPRRYLIVAEPGRGDRAGVDRVQVPTADGIDVRLEAKISFNTVFTGAGDDRLLRTFDAQFGNRTYPLLGAEGRLHPWEGDEGFAAFLDVEFRPVLDSAVREAVNEFRCRDLVSSCALVQARGGAARLDVQGQNTANLARLQAAIADTLRTDLRQNLGNEYFTNVRVVVSSVRLPEQVQRAVNDAQAAFAEVTRQEADVRKATIRKQANDILGRGYERCPACAQQDAIRALPDGADVTFVASDQTVAVGGGKAGR